MNADYTYKKIRFTTESHRVAQRFYLWLRGGAAKLLWGSISTILLLSACTKNEISYRETNHLPVGIISIRPDISQQTVPALAYHFYPVDGSEPIVCPCDGQGNFEGKLPAGSYRVIATNVDAKNVSFAGMFSFETATVAVLPQSSSRAESIVVFFQPDAVYSVVPSQLEVLEGDTVLRRPLPMLLTRTLTLRFILGGGLLDRVEGMSGVLRGVYSSMNLATGRPDLSAIAGSPSSGIAFGTEGNTGGFGTSVSLFGIADPGHGEQYENRLGLSLTLTDGTTEEMEIDLTTVLSDIIKENQGDIPVDIPLELDVELEWDGIKVKGTVRPWQNGGTGTGEIEK